MPGPVNHYEWFEKRRAIAEAFGVAPSEVPAEVVWYLKFPVASWNDLTAEQQESIIRTALEIQGQPK